MRASLQYCIMDNKYKKHFFSLLLLKIFRNFWNISRKKSMQERPFSGVYKIDVLKKFANFTKKFQWWSHFLKVSRNKETPAQVFSCEFCEAFKSTIFTEHLRYEVGVSLLKCFTFRSSTNSYLIVWSFSMLIAKTIWAISISFLSIFSITCFFY